jgi:hypothetical protein
MKDQTAGDFPANWAENIRALLSDQALDKPHHPFPLADLSSPFY